MADMHHEIFIDASPEKAYEAIATQEGLRSWWTADSVAQPGVGSVAEFGFYKRQFFFRMRIDELTPGKRVVWSCLARIIHERSVFVNNAPAGAGSAAPAGFDPEQSRGTQG